MSNYEDLDLEFDLDNIVSVFGPPIDSSAPERGYYRFRYGGHPGRKVTMSFNKYERRVSGLVEVGETATAFSFERADTIKVLEVERRTLAVTSANVRAFFALDGVSVMDIEVNRP